MASRSNSRLSQEVITKDRTILAAVMNLGDYAPTNVIYNTDSVQQLEAAMLAVLQAESRIQQEADAIRDQAIAAMNAFHKGVKGIKHQVKAQYGEDSVALHAIGLKKVSERKRPTRRPRKAAKQE
ncbi:MAG: hypothetical protein HGA45_40725 [Chloroflexales bacterium]|nr:hypothetical protein [Chloroflexales bacterium]